LAERASEFDKNNDVGGVYWTLNPVKPKCLHRAKNRIIDAVREKSGLTSDKDISERRLILLDFDGADRPSGISADHTELEAAWKKAVQTVKFLSGKGWEAPIVGMSGNGYHLLYKVQLPNDKTSENWVKKLLNSLAVSLNDEVIKLDTTVFNAARISKVYGTVARKGDNTEERPHRRSRLLGIAGEDFDYA
jgi:hypothetical protein